MAVSPAQKSYALLKLCEQKYSLPADSLHLYATQLKNISNANADNLNIILADFYIAYSLMLNGNEDSSMKVVDYYLDKLSKGTVNKDAYMLFLQLKGTLYYRTNKSKETIKTFYDLLSEAQQRRDTFSMLIAKRGISLAYIVNGQDLEGLKIFYNAKELIAPEFNKKYDEAYGLLSVNAAISFLHLHQATSLPSYADSCEYYGKQAIYYGEKTENLFVLCQGYVVRGLILSYKKEMEAAEKSLQKGLAFRQLIGDTLYIISDMSVLASFYANTKQPEKGIALCRKGIELAQKRKISPALLLLLYNALAENYKVKGNYKEYAEALRLQMSVKDSLSKKNSGDELKNLEAKYDLQKQENTIIQQKLNITRKNLWLYGSLLFTLMAIAISWVLFKNYRRKQNRKMKLAVEEEKRIAVQSVIDAEEHERKRIAADLHDNLGVYAASLSSNLGYLPLVYKDSGAADALQELKNNSNAIISELNDTIWVLKKDELSLTNISDRIKVFISRISKSYPEINIEVDEKIKTDYKLPSSQAFHLYRIVQEAVNNSLKHSKGKNITVTIDADTNWSIFIKDDGVGIRTYKEPSTEGNGLLNMKERSKEAGWDIKWVNSTNGGTIVAISPTTN